MRLSPLGAALAAAALLLAPPARAADAPTADQAVSVDDPARYVNPFVGTAPGGLDYGNGGGGGNTFPGASAPLGGIQWSPDTVTPQFGGYAYGDNRIRGFSLTHLSGAGCSDYGNVPFMPLTGRPAPDPAARHAAFSHTDEEATPGSYRVDLGNGIRTELAATARSGIARFSYPANAADPADPVNPADPERSAGLTVDAGQAANKATGEITVGSDTLSGFTDSGGFCKSTNRYRLYFHAVFDQPFAHTEPLDGKTSGAYVSFAPGTRTVTARVGVSFVSVAAARDNARAEQRGLPYDAVRRVVRGRWNDWLGRIAVRGGTQAQRRMFYSALYHSLLHPSTFSDADGRYRGMDGEVHRTEAGHVQYANFSGWDVYRSQVQLLALLAPREASDVARSILDQGVQAGYFDRWTLANGGTRVMVGDPLPAMAASLHAFGATDFDARALLRSAVAGRQDDRQRPGHETYDTLGYIPAGTKGVWGSAATTLEYAVADAALAQLAGRLGETATQTELRRASGNWRNLLHPDSRYLQPRAADGAWPAFSPTQRKEYVEGNAAQYTWMVPHDFPALFAAMGGDAAVTARLDAFFTHLNAGADEPYSYLGNEPSFNTPWAYDYAGRPDRTQDVVRRALTTLFNDRPEGLVGNDDLGAMSSWAVWASLGMYPQTPGSSRLALASPLFPAATVHRGDGVDLTVLAPDASETASRVRGLTLDGRPVQGSWLPDAFPARGGVLRYDLTAP
ncbi:GH92 family glycosyl hydrolase [Streptomyces sp. NBC_01275]|uniref:GH92 family glycosyl hydrolase n=1 Tax=Streptomyces sp. NBC_01275 TaxID=2903807 RepID=UPI0022509BD9|nr:GH92 family glycosyl hydrolase [Streptomyces sp. NBC_01275]MCX4760248.1 GH92 family glycosyl hydrolase [Streptomyces sp. NBC_01275]